MMFYEFTDVLKTGNRIIDGEHEFLLNTANEAFKQIESGVTQEQILLAVKKLAHYVTTHFEHEEDLMKQYRYTKMRTHSLWHQSYKNDIDVTCNRIIEEGISGVTANEVKRRIEVLTKHILSEDMKLAKYIQDNPL